MYYIEHWRFLDNEPLASIARYLGQSIDNSGDQNPSGSRLREAQR